MRKHFHNDDDQHDALNDYLEAHLGFPPADSRAGELAPDMRDTVEEFLDLAERAGAIPAAHHQPRRPAMNATLPVSGALPASTRSRRRTQPSLTLPAWTRHLQMVSTGLLILVVAALSFAAFGPNGIGSGGDGTGTGDDLGLFGAVPIATVPDDAETSSIPYPSADECTVEPMTREEVIEHLHAANEASDLDQPIYNIGIEPSEDVTEAIMSTFRDNQACGGMGRVYSMRFETPWRTANNSPLFLAPSGADLRPVSNEQIENHADVLLAEEPIATPDLSSRPEISTPPDIPLIPGRLPIPDGATPVASPYQGRPHPTVFPEDITMNRPNSAVATAYFVFPETRQVLPTTPLTYEFVDIDGEWLIDSYQEGPIG